MEAAAQHVCSRTAFEPFPDAALEGSLVDRFTEQVAAHHDCVAVADGAEILSYGQLDGWANGVAHAIVECDGPTRGPVALVVAQGAAYSAAVLGVLKSGRPYVPLEPSDPTQRLRQLVASCGATVMVADRRHAGGVAREAMAGAGEVVLVDEIQPRSEGPQVDVGPDDVAYIFFTSGSTGAPKGVYDSHRNVLHNVLRYTNALQIAPTDRLSLLQGPSFSGCVSSQFGALLNGAASYPFWLAEEGLVRAAAWVRQERITIYHSVPSIFRAVVARGGRFDGVRVVRLEGDRATSEDVEFWKRHFSRSCVLANGLGTTETGLARQLILRHDDEVEHGLLPVGNPVRDMAVLLVDEHREPVPEGDVGEIAVASDYLALGYWRRPDLTGERFATRGGTRRYFTGDLGRLRPNGCLEYLGRREGDLKVLGARVEPGEIEGELLRLDGVRDAAVAVDPGPRGEGRVVAYVVGATVELGSVRTALADRLPSAMLPAAVVELDALPLGPHGKIDRRALPDPPAAVTGTAECTSADERWLAGVWSDVLGVEKIGRDDDFFALGGDSLAAAEILARVEVETGRAPSVATLVRAPTVAAFAATLTENGHNNASSLTVLQEGDGTPLVLLHGNAGNSLHYTELIDAMADAGPIWTLEYFAEDDYRIEAIAARHADVLRAARPAGPVRLAGFCYGAVVAHELAAQLASDGFEVEFLALLGVTSFEFPTLLTGDASASWGKLNMHRSFSSRMRYHLRRASLLSGRQRVDYLARRFASLVSRPFRRQELVLTDAQQALLHHEPQTYPGRTLVVLHDLDVPPAGKHVGGWKRLSATVDVLVLPGTDHDMLEDPGVRRLAEVLTDSGRAGNGSP
jgi:amino acid adenylation domain-containing protein